MSDFDWKQIAGPLINIGATTLGTVIGGPTGGAVGKAVGPILAGALGVPSTPGAVADAIAKSPETVRTVEATPEVQAAIERATTEHIQAVNETYRLELQSESPFVRYARPAWLWVGALVWGVHGLALGLALFRKDFEALRAIPDLTAFYVVMGGVAGVYAWRRTDEKRGAS